MKKSRDSNRSEDRKKCRLSAVLLGAGCLAAAAGIVSSAEQPRGEYRIPEIICSPGEGAGGWYQTEPEVRIIHTDPHAVTGYRVETDSGTVLEGKICPERMPQEDSDREPEDGGKQETGADSGLKPEEGREGPEEQKKEAEKEEDGKTKMLELPAEIWEEGENHLTVWMETSDRKEEIWKTEKVFLLDRTDPGTVAFSFPGRPEGEGLFFREEAEIKVDCEDTVSGVSGIICILEDGTEKRLEGGHAELTIPAGYRGSITAYAEDRAGRIGKRSSSEMLVCEDEPPEIFLSVPGGFESWHRGYPEVTVSVRESGEKYGFSSGLASLTCHVSGKTVIEKYYPGQSTETVEKAAEEQVSLKPEEMSENGKPVTVTVFASDRAGNTAVRTETLYIDLHPPDIRISGFQNSMITGKEVRAEFTVTDDNLLEDAGLVIWRRDGTGKRMEIMNARTGERENQSTGKMFYAVLQEEGVYEFAVSASDRAGYRTEKHGTFTIDRTSPVIRYVDQMNGAHIRFFQWNYRKEEMVKDFTESEYWMYLDGSLYLPGSLETEEGVHLLEVRSEDAAGNQSYARAAFTIDHTPPEIHCGDLEEGGVYDEGVLVSIWVDGGGERLKSLVINGERQKLSAGSRIFQYEIREEGVYTLEVSADDLTGNEAEKRISFKVRERKGLADTIFSPVSRVFSGQEEEKDGRKGGNAFLLPAGAVCAAAVCGILGRRLCRIRRKRKNADLKSVSDRKGL